MLWGHLSHRVAAGCLIGALPFVGNPLFAQPAPGTAAAAPAPIPVKVAVAAKRDFPMFSRSIGTVQAYNSVFVVSRVDGELQKIAFAEGQRVRAGDLLAQVDPRPFEAQLRQAEATRDRDKALLATAELDFGRSSQLIGQGFATRQTYDTQKN